MSHIRLADVGNVASDEATPPRATAKVRSYRHFVATALVVAAFVLVALPAVAAIKLDPIMQSDLISCRGTDDAHAWWGTTCDTPIVEARETLESFGVLDDAAMLWEPMLILRHDIPALMMLVVALRQARRGRVPTLWRGFVLAGAVVVILTMIVPQVVYAETIDAATMITD